MEVTLLYIHGISFRKVRHILDTMIVPALQDLALACRNQYQSSQSKFLKGHEKEI